MPTRCINKQNRPEGGALLCANHTRTNDPLFIAYALGWHYQIHVMAKEEIRHWPFIGWVLKHGGIFGVKRGKADVAAIKTAMKYLKDGELLLMFPEGTRHQDGEFGDAKTGAAMLALRTGVPIVPIYLPAEKKWFRWNPVVFGEAYYPKAPEGRKPTPEDYHAVADDLMERIEAEASGWPVRLELARCAGFYAWRAPGGEAGRAGGGGGDPCVMLGPIIHNRSVIAYLESIGVGLVDTPEEVPPGTAVLSAPRGGRAVHEALARLGRPVIDATCPNVSRIHQIVSRAEEGGRQVLIIGTRTHPEVAAIAGWCRRPVVLAGVAELSNWLKPRRNGGKFRHHGVSNHLHQIIWDSCVEKAKKLCTN